MKTVIIAHRGASGYELENTLAAFQKSIDMGVDGIELDVHLCADGEIMVIHDDSVDRTTSASGLVSDLSLSQLRGLAPGRIGIPTLSEVLDLINKKCIVNIELKGAETAIPVVKLIEEYILTGWTYDLFIVSSFDWNALREVRLQNPSIPIGVLTSTDLDLAIRFSEFIKAETIHPYYHLLTPENTNLMHQKGLTVLTWTVNEPADITQMKLLKVNGIITDFPDRI